MQELQVAWRPLHELIPYARNPRSHSDAQVTQIAGSICEFGWTNPVLVDGANGIIAGHGRVLAARQLGLDRVPVIGLAHLSEAQRRAYVLADNQLALNAGWDEALLKLELADLSDLGFELGLIGFGAGELERLVELDPKYVDVIVRRWQDWSGKSAVLDEDGQTFEQASAQRIGAADHTSADASVVL